MAGSSFLPVVPPSLVGMMANHADQYTVHHDETPGRLEAAFETQNAETFRVFAKADLDATIVVPDHIQAIFEDPHWTVRWVLLHIIEEMARHAGRADIIRESIDGATMYQLLAALEGWSVKRRVRAEEMQKPGRADAAAR
jgi:hypothetical protein